MLWAAGYANFMPPTDASADFRSATVARYVFNCMAVHATKADTAR